MDTLCSSGQFENYLNTALHSVLVNLHQNPYPFVPNPPSCKKRASVALIIRIHPDYLHWPGTSEDKNNRSIPVIQQLNNFFAREWVRNGDPEVLFIKRASRLGDRWTGHVALPGGKKDPDDKDDKAAAVRETLEEIGLVLSPDNCINVGNLPERLVTTSWGTVPLMVLCPFIFLLTSSHTPTLRLQPAEVASVHWVPLRVLLSSSLRTVEHVNITERYAKWKGLAPRLVQRWVLGLMNYAAIRLVPSESLHCTSVPSFLPKGGRKQQRSRFQDWKAWCLGKQAFPSDRDPLLLWGLTLGILTDFLQMLPPHNAVELWTYPLFTPPDLRLIVNLLTYRLRRHNILKAKSTIRALVTATDSQMTTMAPSLAVREAGSEHAHSNEIGITKMRANTSRALASTDKGTGTGYAVGILLQGYYARFWPALYIFFAWRAIAGGVVILFIWKRLRLRLSRVNLLTVASFVKGAIQQITL